VENVSRVIEPLPQEKVIEVAAKFLNEAGVLIYINRECPSEWKITYQRLVVPDPNWFCNKIVGHIFLTEEMLVSKEHLFRDLFNLMPLN
jgi:hypothetical protein